MKLTFSGVNRDVGLRVAKLASGEKNVCLCVCVCANVCICVYCVFVHECFVYVFVCVSVCACVSVGICICCVIVHACLCV